MSPRPCPAARAPHRLTPAAVLVFLVLLSATTPAQVADVRFRHLSVAEGLSQSTVNVILQDRRGFLWFGTQDGLNRFDGYTFRVSRAVAGDPRTLRDNFIWALEEDADGRLWIGTLDGGLACYDPDRDSMVSYLQDPRDSAGLAGNNVTALAIGPEGELYVGMWTRGLQVRKRGSNAFARIPLPFDDSVGCRVRSLTMDHAGILWVGTWEGLASYDPATGRTRAFLHDARVPSSLSGNRIQFVLPDSSGGLWVGTYDRGLNRLDPSTGRAARIVHDPSRAAGLGSNHLLTACFDLQGRLWIGTEDAGVDVLDPSDTTVHHLRSGAGDPGSLRSNRIFSLHADRQGALWVGTADAGVSRCTLTRPNFQVYRAGAPDGRGLSHNVVRAMLEDPRGRVWIGTAGGGLNCLDPATGDVDRYGQPRGGRPAVPATYIFSLCRDAGGTIWIGTQNEGIVEFDPASGRTRRHDRLSDGTSLRGSAVMAILPESSGAMLFGTSGRGLLRLAREAGLLTPAVITGSTRVSEQPRDVWALHRDRSGHLWLGTWGAGVWKLDHRLTVLARHRRNPADPGGLGNNTIMAFHEDAAGTLWLGTAGGLDRLDPVSGTFRHYTVDTGLPNNVVYGILPDDRGRLWVSTNLGLARMDTATGACRAYDVSDGIQGNEFNQGAFCRSHTGMLFFGGTQGITAFHPDSLLLNMHVPPIVLTSFRVFDRPVPLTARTDGIPAVTIGYDENFISFEFAALDFTAPDRNQYAYRLEGSDPGWVWAGTRRYAAYTHLDPGTHVFRVKGSNNDGVWNEEGLALSITITPPFWRTPWFAGATLAAVLLVAAAFHRARIRRLVELERLRTRIASDLHDELASNLSSIAMFSNILYDATRADRPLAGDQDRIFRRITALAQESVASIRDIIWAIDPRRETIADLLVRLRDGVLLLCRARNIRLVFEDPSPASLPGHNLSPEQRQNLWMLLKEAVMNAVTHSSGTEIAVSWFMERRVFAVRVADNGAGFDAGVPSRGKGLDTMRMRARRLGGSADIRSEPGTGTTVEIRIPLGKGAPAPGAE